MNIHFATCERHRALQYIQKVYPGEEITDTPESISDLLDLVNKDIVRVQDPFMHGNRIAIIPGNKWNKKYRADVEQAAETLKNLSKK